MKMNKKMIVCLGILFLGCSQVLFSGCTDIVKAAKKSSNTEYYKIATKVVNKYGRCNGDINGSKGLAYAQLIDFDHNGTNELYMIYLKDAKSYDVTQEIWGMKNKKAVKLFEETHNGSGLVNDRSLSLCKSKTNGWLI